MSQSSSYIDCYDLHLHTYWSYDATANPESYFRRARELGVRCLAVTDHHVLDSLDEVLTIAEDYPEITVIPSAELTVSTSLGSVDLLCYGFPAQSSKELQELRGIYRTWQQETGAAIPRALQALGHDFTQAQRVELLQSYRPSKALRTQGMTHVKNGVLRQYFLERGFIASQAEYSTLMGRARKTVPFPTYPHVESVVSVVKGVGALIAIAHPHGYFRGYDVSRMDQLRDECCLDGIECINKHLIPPECTRLYRAYCEQHGLISTAGSDCHADEDIPDVFAHHQGFPHYEESGTWLDEFLDRLDKPRRSGPDRI